MPTTIDIENAKQIREPMDIYVSLDAIEYDTTMSVSISGSVKVSDTSTIRYDYQMRKLADLQMDGFPLDGSCKLYDSSEIGSVTNGKIGVRGNINSNVVLSVSSNKVISIIMVSVAGGCDSVKCNGTTYSVDNDGKAIIYGSDLRNKSITLYCNDSTARVEVSQVVAGLQLAFTNDNLISVNLSLRSDLKPFDPSLPESCIEINAYYPNDISMALSAVQDEKPITYQSGYDSDLSEARHFYLSEPATWEKGVLTIKGVDSVHKLDSETCPIFIGDYFSWKQGASINTVWGYIRKLYIVLEDQLHMADIMNPCYDYLDDGHIEAPPSISADSGGVLNKYVGAIIERQSHRDVIANLMNLCRFTFGANWEYSAFWPTYVDAGIPKLTWTKPTSKWDIYESDCGNVQNRLDKKVVKINYKSGTIRHTGPTNVKLDSSVTAFKNSGISFDYSEYSLTQQFYYRTDSPYATYYFTTTPSYSNYYLPANWTADDDLGDPTYGVALYDSGVDKNKLIIHNMKGSTWGNIWRLWKDWTASYGMMWDNIVGSGAVSSTATSLSLETEGQTFIVDKDTSTYSIAGTGAEQTLDKTSWIGEISASNGYSRVKVLPDMGIKQLLERSNETGSFTWKGDPRMQPRDVFTFHRLDGNTELCTIESIELKHAKGGTMAEITYRKGIV